MKHKKKFSAIFSWSDVAIFYSFLPILPLSCLKPKTCLVIKGKERCRERIKSGLRVEECSTWCEETIKREKFA